MNRFFLSLIIGIFLSALSLSAMAQNLEDIPLGVYPSSSGIDPWDMQRLQLMDGGGGGGPRGGGQGMDIGGGGGPRGGGSNSSPLTSCDFTMKYANTNSKVPGRGYNGNTISESGCKSKFNRALNGFLKSCPEGIIAVDANFSYGLSASETSQYGCVKRQSRVNRRRLRPDDRGPAYHKIRSNGARAVRGSR